MIKCAKEMRATAAAALKGKWGGAVLTTFVYMAIGCVERDAHRVALAAQKMDERRGRVD